MNPKKKKKDEQTTTHSVARPKWTEKTAKDEYILSVLAKRFNVHPNQITQGSVIKMGTESTYRNGLNWSYVRDHF